MHWNEIRDPTGEVEIRATFDKVRLLFLPDEVQALISERGVIGAVRVLNPQMKATLGYPGLCLSHDRNTHQKILVEYV